MPHKVRIGAVSYLNSRPLVYGLKRGTGSERIELSYDVPAGLSEAMIRGRLDVALLPVIEYARIPDLEVVPGLGIVTYGAARSVLLIGNRPVSDMRRVALDRESRSSNALLQVLFARVWRRRPEFEKGSGNLHDDLREWDGVLRIGDKALFQAVPRDCRVYDLGTIWTESTGLPFVFAAWIARRGVVDGGIRRALHDSRRAGCEVIDRIAEEFDWDGTRDPQLARDYLRRNIRFDLEDDGLRAMRLFFEASRELELIDHVPEIRLVGELGDAYRPSPAAGAES